ncbi:hypothetical protein CRX72_04745 [Pantoea sp. BRM17]|nr:hypothetical protein CRX72_04745 [Pantoea sp. BRM17]
MAGEPRQQQHHYAGTHFCLAAARGPGAVLFSNAALTAPIPINSAIALNYSNANTITLPVYGQLTLPGTAQAGTYTDTLTVTLSW